MSGQKFIKSMTGYKATDADMKCKDHQFVLGEWSEITGDIAECERGFHFCEQPSGVWAYYSNSGTRVFKVEAEDVLEKPFEAGTAFKRVCRRIKLVEEVKFDGDGNTGDGNTGTYNTGRLNIGDSNTGYYNTGNGNTGNGNTGYRNTGNSNTGNGNTGYRNTGDSNTGDSNTGNSNTGRLNTGYRNTGNSNTGNGNTGYRNTGDSNTGDSNTGNGNTGNGNTGYRNTGNSNTGNSNTGDSNTGDSNTGRLNTGDGNATNLSSGCFCVKEPKAICFDLQTEYTLKELRGKFDIYGLSVALMSDNPIDFDMFKDIPNITEEKLKALHEKHIEARKRKGV